MTGLVEGWELASAPSGACNGPADLSELAWGPARVPGTAAAAVGADGRDFDADDWWFRTSFAQPTPGGARVMLELDGIATVSEVYLNGEQLLTSRSMWASHAVDVSSSLRERNELVIGCRALKPLLGARRRPRARWRTRVVNEGNLRWFRTMIFGRSPGFAPGPAPVGPWRPVRLVEYGANGLDALLVRPRIEDGTGVVVVRAKARGAPSQIHVEIGGQRASLDAEADGWSAVELRIPSVERWWPHTHGEPVLHELTVTLDGECVATRRVGFRSLTWASDIRSDGLDLHVNGVPVFARGAVWTPADLISLAPSEAELRSLLERTRACGMNMLRVVGTGAYESHTFHDLCDELGILVWQDLMFANLDYPLADPEFRAEVEREARAVIDAIAGRPSLAVLCGNSEVEQQAAFLGLDHDLGRDELWDEVLPEIASAAGLDCAYVASTPCGGDLPFHAARGIVHYFGVSGYFRGLEDARRAGVRFAAESLAFANVPDRVDVPVHHPEWKQGVARDAGTGWDLGAGWDFDDVRDFYLQLLFAVDPVQLRRSELERYLELSRATSGEVMAEVIGEWRRSGSPCRGALVLWLKDMLPGAGLGVLDHRGEPKVAFHHLRRAMAPVAVWTTDEGVDGIAIHTVNDRPTPLHARLRVALYRDLEARVGEAEQELELAAHGAAEHSVEGLLGRFVDAAWAYRFGPPAQDAIVVSLRAADRDELLSQSFRFPAGRPIGRESAARFGIECSALAATGGPPVISISCERLLYGVRIHVPGFDADDDAFSVEPGHERVVRLQPCTPEAELASGFLSALNLDGPVKIKLAPA